MTVVRFSGYQKYEATIIEASNALLALLAGSKLASHLLQLTEGSPHLLPEVFPKVDHIGRFNLTSNAARQILEDADTHLGAMGVAYALSLHEDYMKTCLQLLLRAKLCTNKKIQVVSAYQHSVFESATSETFSANTFMQFVAIRKMRNCSIHQGGRADSSLVNEVSKWPTNVEEAWTRLAIRSPRGLNVGDRVVFGHGELFLALAVTKNLAREANEILQRVLPRAQWSDMLIDDLIEMNPKALRAPDLDRRVYGFARFNFGPLKLSHHEIQDALGRR